MILKRLAPWPVLGFGLCACSIYPTPQNFSGYGTTAIIEQFRCDFSYAVRANGIDWIRGFGEAPVYPGYTGASMARALLSGERRFDDFPIEKFYPEPQRVLKYYKQAKVGYDFTLQAVEDNTQSAGLGATRVINARVDTIGALGQNQLTRDVSRNFRLQDDFEHLTNQETFDLCSRTSPRVNIEYPSTGRLPMYDLVYNFIQANEFQNLQGDERSPAIPKMADTIIFTTKLTGNFDPGFALAPFGAGFLLSGATFRFDNLRTDKHTVIVAITVPERSLRFGVDGKPVASAPTRGRAASEVTQTLNEQRDRNVQNAIIQIGNNISRFPF